MEIGQVGGLTAVLNTFKNATDSDTADTTLQNNLNTLEDAVNAIPTSQMLVNGAFLDQAQFSIANAVQQLNLGLSIWEWLVQPSWSDIQRDPARLRLARTGDLPLTPAAYCLMYFPFTTSLADLGPGGLHIVTNDTDVDQGEWGVYKHMAPQVMGPGWVVQACRSPK